jgi:hypothetical protein
MSAFIALVTVDASPPGKPCKDAGFLLFHTPKARHPTCLLLNATECHPKKQSREKERDDYLSDC